MTRRAVLCSLLMPSSAAGAPVPVIVDTDVGSDDLLAIAFLLARKDVQLEAFTVVNGLAHVQAGAKNLLRLLELSGRTDIPVYLGSERPLLPTAPFPDEWRRVADELPGVNLPETRRTPAAQSAMQFLAKRLRDRHDPVAILALGPLTNIAEAFRLERRAAVHVQRLVVMGGAFQVQGNLGDGGAFKTNNNTAEWNIFSDPLAAERVFDSGARIDVVPLDATSKVPIGPAFLQSFEDQAQGPLARFAVQVLEAQRASIEAGFYQAWDPLAAAALSDSSVVQWVAGGVAVRQLGEEAGRTLKRPGLSSNTRIALTANAAEFKRLFLSALR